MSPYTVDVGRFALSRALTRQQARASVGIPDDQPVVLFVGKLTERKRPLDLVRAMRLIGSPARLVIAGSGPLASRVAAEARRENIPLTELGFINQSRIPCVYRAADVVALPSTWEPWGLAVNEAMATGTTPVCSAGVSAADDLVGPVSERLIHPVGDVPALADALSYALANRSGLEAGVMDRIEGWTYRESVAGILQAFQLAISAHG
jgi:glycosyltransferase involved in cell wall biosynthesis